MMLIIIVCAASELKMFNFFFPTSFLSHTPRFLRCFLRLRVLGSQRGHRTLQGLEWILPTLPTLPTLPFGYTTTYRPFWFLIVWARNYFRVWRVVGPGRTCHEIQNGGNLKNNFRLSDPPESYETPVYNQRNGVFLRCEICMALGPWGSGCPRNRRAEKERKAIVTVLEKIPTQIEALFVILPRGSPSGLSNKAAHVMVCVHLRWFVRREPPSPGMSSFWAVWS